METKENAVMDLSEIREIYDEHEARAATYKGEDLSGPERLNLGLDALADICGKSGRSINDYVKASQKLQEKLKEGETLGAAVSAGVNAIDQE